MPIEILKEFDEKTRRKKILRLVLSPTIGFIVGSVILYLILGRIIETLIFGFALALGLFLQEWNWVRGKRFGMFSGDQIGPTPEEEFDEAVRKMKEKGDKL